VAALTQTDRFDSSHEVRNRIFGIAEGILQDLHDDHKEVASLIDSMMDNPDTAERDRLFEEMRSKLVPHLEAEQEVLYKRLATSKSHDARSFAQEGASEHRLVEQQLRKMWEAGGKAGEGWSAELKVLEGLIEHHVYDEESAGFSCARKEFSTEELEAMARQFQTLKAQLMVELA
jgi:hemerythrin-like domain-containing protein